jgi:mono/diheme cytochrome c family protein
MLDSLLQFLEFLPAGLLFAAVCLEGFVLSRRDRDSEPAVLWLLYCAAVAAALVSVLGFTLYFTRIDPEGLKSGLWSGLLAAAASVAWMFKRVARNRSFLLLRERFYDTSKANRPPCRKPWQAFLIIGYRATLAAALTCGVLGLWQSGATVPRDQGDHPATAGASSAAAAPVAAAVPVGPVVPVDDLVPLPPAAPASGTLPMVDPTRSEIPSADASAVAALATSAALTTGASAATPAVGADPAVPVVAVVPEPLSRPVSKNSLYFSKIRPIFAKSCISCHGPKKQKGDLRLDTPDFIRAGVNGKPVIVPGVPEKSRVYHVTGLPQDDTDFMPPKGTPLNTSERAVLAEWIKTGADLGDGVSIPAGHDGIFLVDTLAANLSAPDPAIIEDLKKDHVVIRALSKNGFVLELDFSHSDRAQGDLKLSQLGPIARHIYAIDFSRTRITDADLGQLLPMKNLSRLLLSRTGITDAGLNALKNNASLEQINLYETAVTDAGLATLASLKSLKKVYLWQSKATPEGAKQLQEQVPGLVVSIGQ